MAEEVDLIVMGIGICLNLLKEFQSIPILAGREFMDLICYFHKIGIYSANVNIVNSCD